MQEDCLAASAADRFDHRLPAGIVQVCYHDFGALTTLTERLAAGES